MRNCGPQAFAHLVASVPRRCWRDKCGLTSLVVAARACKRVEWKIGRQRRGKSRADKRLSNQTRKLRRRNSDIARAPSLFGVRSPAGLERAKPRSVRNHSATPCSTGTSETAASTPAAAKQILPLHLGGIPRVFPPTAGSIMCSPATANKQPNAARFRALIPRTKR